MQIVLCVQLSIHPHVVLLRVGSFAVVIDGGYAPSIVIEPAYIPCNALKGIMTIQVFNMSKTFYDRDVTEPY